MNFLQTTSVVCRRAVFAFVIISSLAFAAFAQGKSAQEGCRTYGCAGFIGEPINLKVVNADIRDILNYITEQYGINFVIDKSVTAVPVTVNTGAARSSRPGVRASTPPAKAFSSDSTRQLGGVLTSIPPKTAYADSRARGASSTSRRSS